MHIQSSFCVKVQSRCRCFVPGQFSESGQNFFESGEEVPIVYSCSSHTTTSTKGTSNDRLPKMREGNYKPCINYDPSSRNWVYTHEMFVIRLSALRLFIGRRSKHCVNQGRDTGGDKSEAIAVTSSPPIDEGITAQALHSLTSVPRACTNVRISFRRLMAEVKSIAFTVTLNSNLLMLFFLKNRRSGEPDRRECYLWSFFVGRTAITLFCAAQHIRPIKIWELCFEKFKPRIWDVVFCNPLRNSPPSKPCHRYDGLPSSHCFDDLFRIHKAKYSTLYMIVKIDRH